MNYFIIMLTLDAAFRILFTLLLPLMPPPPLIFLMPKSAYYFYSPSLAYYTPLYDAIHCLFDIYIVY